MEKVTFTSSQCCFVMECKCFLPASLLGRGRGCTYVTNLEKGSSGRKHTTGQAIVHARKMQTFGLVLFIRENGNLGKYIYATVTSIPNGLSFPMVYEF